MSGRLYWTTIFLAGVVLSSCQPAGDANQDTGVRPGAGDWTWKPAPEGSQVSFQGALPIPSGRSTDEIITRCWPMGTGYDCLHVLGSSDSSYIAIRFQTPALVKGLSEVTRVPGG